MRQNRRTCVFLCTHTHSQYMHTILDWPQYTLVFCGQKKRTCTAVSNHNFFSGNPTGQSMKSFFSRSPWAQNSHNTLLWIKEKKTKWQTSLWSKVWTWSDTEIESVTWVTCMHSLWSIGQLFSLTLTRRKEMCNCCVFWHPAIQLNTDHNDLLHVWKITLPPAGNTFI